MKYTKQEDEAIKLAVEGGKSWLEISKELGGNRTPESIRKRYQDYIKNGITNDVPAKEKKVGIEVMSDHVVYNHTTKTVITELGEYGQYVCSIDMHKRIMRAYSDQYEGKGETQAEIAMRYDFPHAKAVAKYMKHHGMTKSMPGQTDLEIMEGLTVEDAVDENIQSIKRQIHKKTEQRKWVEIQNAAEKWWQFHHGQLKPFENHIEQYLPKNKIKPLKLGSYKKGNTVSFVGISDVHYMKLCYDAFGKEIYNREIAKERLSQHASELVKKHLQAFGIPEKFLLPVGTDNLHIDNPLQTTTRGTQQANSTAGSYRIELGQYVDMTMALIEAFAQVAPVDVVSIPGNHDNNTSYLLGTFLVKLYEKEPQVNVIHRMTERVYLQYGKVCFIVSHGDKISLSRTEREVHKLILAEARTSGININEIDEFVFIMGHLHHEFMKDVGGFAEIIIIPSMSEEDDWHSDSGYVGAKKNSALYVYDMELGKQAVLYVGKLVNSS